MRDITSKVSSLRQATAQAVVKVSRQETIDAVVNKKVPKGDVFEMAKTAGLFAIKKTPDLIPDCHPLPIEHASISFEIQKLEILISVHITTIYKTGVEVEAMHGASVVALTVYDMLKPLDKEIEIRSIKLLSKKGGKTDFRKYQENEWKAAVVVISDSVARGEKEDRSGKAIVEKLKDFGLKVEKTALVADEPEEIKATIENLCQSQLDLIVTTGGTGLSPRDKTPEAIRSILDQEIPGIMETARGYGQQRTPYAMLSRGVAGLKGKTLVMTLPGSTNGVKESMDALFPYVLHIFKVLEVGYQHQV